MTESIDWGYMLALAATLAASGAVAGFLAGVFGIGGGAVLVPTLYQFLTIFGVDPSVCMHISIATSLGIVVPTSIRSFMEHRARGAVDIALLRSWIIPVPAGAIIASFVAAYVSGAELKGIFAFVALIIAIRMLFNRESWRIGNEIPGNPVRAICGALMGFFSTMMGVGGGVMNNTFMTLFGRPIHQAVATSSGVGILISIPGTIGLIIAGWGEPELPPFSLGYINLLGVALVIPVTFFAAPVGVRVAHALPKRVLEICFGVFLLTVSARFAWSLWG
ncbi:sulfite exporter TauE/SafE family protein [Breoghania sp.]|uniref:sulfite exporter TauE/SafE family protein n=1 Tax=Breoghania sp. TaxID=2065378 RepID=UPI002AA80255|nr:sulfite exporter TauE/SafE family protein [Breoghania sp.]